MYRGLLQLLPTVWQLLFGGKARHCHVCSICLPLKANACYQLGGHVLQWFELFFQFCHSVFSVLKDLVFLGRVS